MNVAVVSPHANKTGATSMALLLALELGKKAKKVCITHTSCNRSDLVRYTGLNETFKNDKTNNPSRLVKMINEGDVKPEEIHDYCTAVADNVEAFVSNGRLQEDELFNVMEFISQSRAFDYVIIDMDEPSMTSIINNNVMAFCDCALLVLNQNVVELEYFKSNNNKILRYLKNLPLTVVVNKYCSITSSIKETAAMLGIKKPNNWVTVRFNAWVSWATNNGKITELSDCISDEKDVRVADLAADLKNVLNVLLKIKVAIRKEKIEDKK